MARPSFSRWGNRLYTGETSYDFVGSRRIWYAVAIAAVVLSIAGLLVRGLNLGVEFVGGAEFRVSDVGDDPTESVARDAVTSVTGPTVEINTAVVGGNSVRVQTGTLDDDQTAEVAAALAEGYGVGPDAVSSQFVGPSWGQEVSTRALTGLLVFLVLVSLVITSYFRTWKMAVAALVALVHDLILTVGVYALVGFEATPASVIGFLTILGYSLYDTVVVFDKVRENTSSVLDSNTRTYREAANLAVNQTVVRSINTSVVALLPVAGLLFIGALLLGAGTLKDLSLALLVGIIAGTYSSIFLATPLLVHLREREPAVKAHTARLLARRGAGPRGGVATAEGGRPAAVRTATAPAGATALGTTTAVLDPRPGADPLDGGDEVTGVAVEGVAVEDRAANRSDDARGGDAAPARRRSAAGMRPGGGQRPQPRRNRPR